MPERRSAMKQNVVAIVPAAGAGKRFGADINKAFFPILGKPIIIWVLEKFQRSSLVSEVIPAFSEDDMERGLRLIEEYSLEKIKKIAPGGQERQDSVFNALKLVGNKNSIMVIHDGVRPLFEDSILEKCLKTLKDSDGVITVVPVKDTIKEAKDGVAVKTLPRENLVSVQTPQVFKYETLLKAYEAIRTREFLFTDDAAVVEASGGRISIVEGSYRNIKVTTPDDAFIVEAFLKSGSAR
jgi:2-C-methyl-D-erythritol 4-phosphate cytidylyltransferase